MSHVGSIMVLAITSACASSDRATGPTNGPYIAASPEAYEGRVIGAGYCVDFVKAAAGLPGLPSGAAIYLHQDDDGIWVYDQWRGQPVHKRLIRFEGGSGGKWDSKSKDGRRFAVIE